MADFRIMSDTKHFYNTLAYHASHNRPWGVWVASFGGFRADWGGQPKLLDYMGSESVSCAYFALGIAPPRPCKEGCTDCAYKYQKYENGVRNLAASLKPNVNVRVLTEFHMKAVAFSDGWCMVGGRNFGLSKWDDLSVFLHAPELATHIQKSVEEVVINGNVQHD